jgi:hypothetical protein
MAQDNFFIGSPLAGAFEYQLQPMVQAEDAVLDGNTSHQPGDAIKTLAETLTTFSKMIEALITHMDTIVQRSDATTAELKQDILRLAECIPQVENRLTSLATSLCGGSNSKMEDTAAAAGAALKREVKDDVGRLSDNMVGLEYRLGNLEVSVRNIEQLLMRNAKKRKKEVTAKSA